MYDLQWLSTQLTLWGNSSVLFLMEDTENFPEIVDIAVQVKKPGFVHLFDIDSVFAGDKEDGCFSASVPAVTNVSNTVKACKARLRTLAEGLLQRVRCAFSGTVIVDPVHLLLFTSLDCVVKNKDFLILWGHPHDRGVYTYACMKKSQLSPRFSKIAEVTGLCIEFDGTVGRVVSNDVLRSYCSKK